ncbi:PHO85 cyclin-5 [Entomophthora muscae]|uniref:PHO85 cyclin-5 n=1 Tax=Entomophthora muscae TaxID=34485 RepID=A0ACC2RQ81_9FUNG|nr:PHO85 cyclin-5 [Entomophthora muscae]
MAIATYRPKTSISHHTLARFLAVSVQKHSCFPATAQGLSFYYKLITKAAAPTKNIVLGMLYMTKLRAIGSSLLREHPGDLLFTACLLLAYDILDDTPYNLKGWSIISNFPKHQISLVVRSILCTLDYRLTIPSSTFNKYESLLMKYVSAPTSAPYSHSPNLWCLPQREVIPYKNLF